jgi:Tfp pilus assembly protein PilV
MVKSRESRVESRKRSAPVRFHSAFRIPHSAITLTEVLISMGILTLGLLGVAAMFPVGSHYMQKGDTADRASALAQSAFSDIMARGVLNPENWLQYEDRLPASILPANGWATNRFARPYATGLRNQIDFFGTNAAYLSQPTASGPDQLPFGGCDRSARRKCHARRHHFGESGQRLALFPIPIPELLEQHTKVAIDSAPMEHLARERNARAFQPRQLAHGAGDAPNARSHQPRLHAAHDTGNG